MNIREKLHNIFEVVRKEKQAIDLVITDENVVELCEGSNLGGRMEVAETVHDGGDSNISNVEVPDGREFKARILNNWSSLWTTGQMSHNITG